MIVTLPTTALSNVTANISGIINDLWPYLAILLGVVIGFFILETIIGAVITWRHSDKPQ
jgi:hypothetical protein